MGTPLKWAKVHGGIEVDWVGYHQDYGRFELGISEARAMWCADWLRRKVTEQRVSFGELKEALGRLVFATGPLEHLRIASLELLGALVGVMVLLEVFDEGPQGLGRCRPVLDVGVGCGLRS